MQRSKVPEPRIIDALKDEVIKKIYCGATFSLFLTINGEQRLYHQFGVGHVIIKLGKATNWICLDTI